MKATTTFIVWVAVGAVLIAGWIVFVAVGDLPNPSEHWKRIATGGLAVTLLLSLAVRVYFWFSERRRS